MTRRKKQGLPGTGKGLRGGGERAIETGELEDGEHSPSPEPERPHHRRRRKRRHEKESRCVREGRDGTPLMDEQAAAAGGLEEGEIGADVENDDAPRGRSCHSVQSDRDRHGHSSTPGTSSGSQGGFSKSMLGAPLAIPFIDLSVPPPTMGGGALGFGRNIERAGSFGVPDRHPPSFPPVDRMAGQLLLPTLQQPLHYPKHTHTAPLPATQPWLPSVPASLPYSQQVTTAWDSRRYAQCLLHHISALQNSPTCSS